MNPSDTSKHDDNIRGETKKEKKKKIKSMGDFDFNNPISNLLMDLVDDYLLLVDRNYNIVGANTRALNYYGENLTGRKCFEVVREKEAPCSDCSMSDIEKYKNLNPPAREVYNPADKKYLLLQTVPIADEEGKVGLFFEKIRDISYEVRLETELKHKDSEIKKMGLTDDLTGLWNRNYMYTRITEEFEKSRRYNRPLSVLILDLDNFKEINERFGHSGGDRIIRKAAYEMKRSIRQVDLIGRIGSQEFMIITESNEASACELAERIKNCVVQNQDEIVGNSPPCTLSGGVASYPEQDVKDAHQLILLSEAAMYYSKRQGKDRITGISLLSGEEVEGVIRAR